jgi:hypothetical protein
MEIYQILFESSSSCCCLLLACRESFFLTTSQSKLRLFRILLSLGLVTWIFIRIMWFKDLRQPPLNCMTCTIVWLHDACPKQQPPVMFYYTLSLLPRRCIFPAQQTTVPVCERYLELMLITHFQPAAYSIYLTFVFFTAVQCDATLPIFLSYHKACIMIYH